MYQRCKRKYPKPPYKAKHNYYSNRGNDLTKDGATGESVSADYEVMVTETKEKFPEAKVIVSGLPPRFSDDNIRLKVKDLNMSLKSWSEQNQIKLQISNQIILQIFRVHS